MKAKHLLMSLVLLVSMSSILLAPACSKGGLSGAPSTPMKGELQLSGPPLLGQPVQLTFTISQAEDYPEDAMGVTANIILPEGFELLEGNLEWQGNVVRGTPVTMQATIRAIMPGDWEINAVSQYTAGEGISYGGVDTLYASVSAEGASYSYNPPTLKGVPRIDMIDPEHPRTYIIPFDQVPTVRPEERPTPPPASKPSSQIDAKLSMSEPPILGKPVQLTFTFKLREGYKWDAPNTTASITLPDGFELVSGELEWHGDITLGAAPVQMQVTVKAIRTGMWEIKAGAFFSLSKGDILGGSAVLYAIISQEGATVSDRVPLSPPTTIPGKPQIPSIEPWMIHKTGAVPPPSATLSGLTI